MRRILTFLSGVICGGALIYFAMNFHVIHSREGYHFVPKVQAQLASTYVDIRDFQVADWAQNAQVAAALVQANRRDLLDNAINDSLNQGIDRLLNRNPQ
ncbi:hypothetical protein [Bythopirellula polymerisocia]|uniref:Uncharacterized protein n=1 Tax=Bythopirellula polymerisocia TaxID=2528003 RepID=A0A5C6CB36_9BACT|nr:hypothetical protein [Bythopirellula polymerisocia]TWU21292.1 hypothetical protein Pla144_47010 [Bythopirellula polymerisocia]